MLVIFCPELALTNSLLMKRPVGRVIFLPLGAVRSTLRSAIVDRLEEKNRTSVWIEQSVRFDLRARVKGLVKNLNMYKVQSSQEANKKTNQSEQWCQNLDFVIESFGV